MLIRATIISLALATPASAHIWDRVMWNDVELRIQVIPRPMPDGTFYAKVVPDGTFYAKAVDLFFPDLPPVAHAPNSDSTPFARRTNSGLPQLAGYTYSGPITYGWCCSSDTPETHIEPPVTPVPLPPAAWMLAMALMLLVRVARRA